MRRSLRLLVLTVAGATLTTVASPAPASAATAPTRVSTSIVPTPVATTWAEGSRHGAWQAAFTGYGRIWSDSVLHLAPKASTRADETHAALVTSVASYRDVDTTTTMTTVSQLRRGTAANPWECAWLLWNYTDTTHFYYLALKPNGLELGKEDPAYPGAQRFLVTTEQAFPVGTTHRVRVKQVGPTMTVYVDGVRVIRFTDTERPYTRGKVGLYNEDSHTTFRPGLTVSQSPPAS